MNFFQGLENALINSLERIILVVFILFVTILVAKVVNIFLHKSFKKSSKILNVDHTKYKFIKRLVTVAIFLIGISISIYVIPSLRNLAVSLLAGAGVIAIIIGFASQQAVANIISGIFIVIFKPFRINDRINIGDTGNLYGIVEDITLRHTVIRNFENKRIIIPNSIISNKTIENSTIEDEKICKWIDIGISYDSDIDKARKIMINEALKNPHHIDNRTKEQKHKGDPEITVRVVGFGDSSVNLRLYVWSKTAVNAWKLGCELKESIKKRFDKEGIEIPFPYRTLVFKDQKKSKQVTKKRKK